ncbi:IS3 family transposase [Streptomyces sp. NPDC058464]|uniref:IS3 family transposase n=1 Tax=Streptomyces sp. NPDC058464 TaxID=3346511 RepID=UPI003653DC1A
MTVHPFIEAEKRDGHSVKRACELLQVSRAAFYARRTGKPGPRAVRDAELTGRITEAHAKSRGTYGAPRIHAVLKREGAACGRHRVARLMRAAGLEGRHRRRRHLTTVPDPLMAILAARSRSVSRNTTTRSCSYFDQPGESGKDGEALGQ